MFQLIVTVISIALIAALAIASIFYGGSAFSGSSAKTGEATLVNGGQQISGAVSLFRTDNNGNNPATLAALVSGNYLQAAPTPPTGVTGTWDLNTNAAYAYIAITANTADVATNQICIRAEADNGSGVGNVTAAVANAAAIALPAGVPFGCVAVTGTGTVFAYKN